MTKAKKQLSIIEKLTLLTGCGGMEAVDLGDGEAIRMADGPCGVKTQDGNAVCFMSTSLMASSWDREICREVGNMIGDEALRNGVDLMLVPAINIKRSPLAGRNFEYYSEDPYLTGTLASAYINGMKKTGTLTCVKHFACNNQESYRWVQNSIVDDDALRNIYLRAFEIVVQNTEVDCIMASYNLVNGVYACENEYLLTDILRREWGYKGVVMSDWCASNDIVQSVRKGMDLEMPGNACSSLAKWKKAYETGELSQERIDEAKDRLLALYDKKPQKKVGAPIGVDIEKLVEMTAESFVLLKNEDVLPLRKEEKILLVGTAKNPRIQGGGCAKLKTNFLTTPYEEMKKYASVCDNVDGYDLASAQNSLSDYDKIIVFLTLPDDCDSEAIDRKNLAFPQEQIDCLYALRAHNENIVAVLQNGSAVDVSFAEEVKGLLETYYAGSYGAVALAEVLYGKISPAGRLAESFPVCLEDTPSYRDFGARTVVYREKEFVGYRYYTTYGVKTAYPFGFGLSYCDFAITNVTVAQTDAYTFTIACDVENKSDFEGKETLQIYLQATSPFEPKMRLLEFASVRLAPREKKHVEIAVERESFVYYRGGKKRLYEGEYALCLGRSCEDIVAQKAVVLQAEMTGAFHENTMMGELLGDERYRDILLRYTEKAIKTWAFGDENTDKNFEEDTFLKMHVYDMPLRGIAYFSGGKLDTEQMQKLLLELNGVKERA